MDKECDPPIVGHRAVRGTMYACIAGSGIVLWFVPIPFLQSLVGYTFAAIAIFLLVGGATAMVGHFTRILLIEKAGYPLILTALASLTGLLLRESDQQAARLFFSMLIFGFTLGLYGRWRDLGSLLKAERSARECDERGVVGDGER